jgi:23S rRNA (uracil1939-C5)-methyltransferase
LAAPALKNSSSARAMVDAIAELAPIALGHRGEGVAEGPRGPIYVPYALPGELIRAEVDENRGRLIEILSASAERIAPICRYFGDCGGCAAQHMEPQLYARWKRDILVRALAQARIDADVAPLVDAHGEGRRRATFHARFGAGRAQVGYMQARTHQLVAIDACPILAPAMAPALASAREIASLLAPIGKPLDLAIAASLAGLDIDLRGVGPLDFASRQALIGAAGRLDLARLSLHSETLIERRPPEVRIGAAIVTPPPGGFLQATAEGERLLAALAIAAVDGARVADLFAGVGAIALRLAESFEVHAVEIAPDAVAALSRAAWAAPGLRPVTCETRDLFRRPLTKEALRRFDAVIFDPPRAGAAAQAAEIAVAGPPRVVAVSCNPATFARDARLLLDGGYRLERVTPIDQFRFSPHLEIVGVFDRPPAKKRRRGLLG